MANNTERKKASVAQLSGQSPGWFNSRVVGLILAIGAYVKRVSQRSTGFRIGGSAFLPQRGVSWIIYKYKQNNSRRNLIISPSKSGEFQSMVA